MNKYRFSNYNVYSTSNEDKDKVVIYNLFTGSIVEIRKQLFHDIKESNLKDDDERIELLKHEGILTDKSRREEYLYVINFLNKIKEYPNLVITIGTTFKCNFACIYCIQKGNYQETPSLDKNILPHIIGWASEYVKKFGIQEVSLNLFGGEPSLTHDLNIQILREFKNTFGESLDYIQMVSNGYYFTESKIKQLKKMGLNAIQITLDGPPFIHNIRRPLKNGQGTFENILQNLVYFKRSNIFINLLTVVDTQNMYYLEELISLVYKKLEGKTDGIKWAFGPIIPDLASIDHINLFYTGKEKKIIEKISLAKRAAKEMGFNVNSDYHINTCFREFYHSYLISPEGDIYVCYSTFGNKRYAIGSIYDSPSVIYKKSKEISDKILDALTNNEECEKCAYFPICRGGCQFMASLENNGEYGHKWCDRLNIARMVRYDLSNKVY